MMIDKIKLKAKEIFPELLQIRRHLHSFPELSFEETNTASFIEKELEKIGILKIERVAETGIVALIEGITPQKKCIALRADIDALPIQELNDVSYKSQNDGKMHACGHDVHTTCLLGAAKILFSLKDHFEGTIKLIFQPGEEKSPGGASLMIKAGVLENPSPDAIIGLHVYPELPVGDVGFRQGQYMASSDEIYIIINGKGGHAALPHTTIDPISIAAQIITALQQVVSRKSHPTMPTVLSFGKIQGGSANNIIPDKVELSGTLRTFNEVWRIEALELIKTISANIATAFGGNVEVNIPSGYPTLYNDPETTQMVSEFSSEYVGKENVMPLDLRMTAEDFSFYTQKIKGCFFRLGTNQNNQKYTTPVHNAHFDIDESAIEVGCGLMAWNAMALLNT